MHIYIYIYIYLSPNRNSRVHNIITKMKNSLVWLTADLIWQKKESVTLKIAQQTSSLSNT